MAARKRTRHSPKKKRPAKKQRTTFKRHLEMVRSGLFENRPFWPYMFLGFILLVFMDQYTKRTITGILPPGFSVKAVPGLWFTHVQNTGAIWGSAPDTNTILITASILVFFVLVYFFDQFRTKGEAIAYTILLAGIWGNLLDRMLLGHVVDFINLGWWPVFNIADSAIVVGILIYLLEQFEKRRAKA